MSAQYIRCTTQCHAGEFDAGTLIQGRLPDAGQALLERFGGQVQMIYLDPPFNTGKKFDMKVRVGEKGYKTGSPSLTLDAYDDKWESREAYLSMMREALVLARGLLKKEGTIFLHIDARMYAHLRLLMDEVFGESNFLNEIVWYDQTISLRKLSGRTRPAAAQGTIFRASMTPSSSMRARSSITLI